MRDPARIDIILAVIRKVWKKYPDWRLGQLVVNVTDTTDPFNTEDEDFLKLAKMWAEMEEK